MQELYLFTSAVTYALKTYAVYVSYTLMTIMVIVFLFEIFNILREKYG